MSFECVLDGPTFVYVSKTNVKLVKKGKVLFEDERDDGTKFFCSNMFLLYRNGGIWKIKGMNINVTGMDFGDMDKVCMSKNYIFCKKGNTISVYNHEPKLLGEKTYEDDMKLYIFNNCDRIIGTSDGTYFVFTPYFGTSVADRYHEHLTPVGFKNGALFSNNNGVTEEEMLLGSWVESQDSLDYKVIVRNRVERLRCFRSCDGKWYVEGEEKMNL
jgi:hypothetical protein